MVRVYHKSNTTDDNANNYGYESWIEYWIKNSDILLPKKCPFCKEKFTEGNKAVGAHVRCTKDWKTYIVPCCNDCNTKAAKRQNDDLPEFYNIDEQLLVRHPPT